MVDVLNFKINYSSLTDSSETLQVDADLREGGDHILHIYGEVQQK